MRIATFGEIMMRLSTQNHNKLIQTNALDLGYAGSEANVAVDLAYWGIDTLYMTVIPDNITGEMVIKDLNQYRVDTDSIVKVPDTRLGLLFLEPGTNQRSSKVVYDREYSAFANTQLDKNYYEQALKGCTWFHWSGITPGLNENCVNNLRIALEVANEKKLTISCDLNYRGKLWNYGKHPDEVMPELLNNTSIILGNEEDATLMLGIENPGIDITNDTLDNELYIKITQSIFDKFPQCETICFSKREAISANHNNWSAILSRRNLFFVSKTYEIKNILDRIGAGDSFSAGIIYGLNHFDGDYEKTLEYATAASCLKHSINGDYCLAKTEEIAELVDGNTKGRIVR